MSFRFLVHSEEVEFVVPMQSSAGEPRAEPYQDVYPSSMFNSVPSHRTLTRARVPKTVRPEAACASEKRERGIVI